MRFYRNAIILFIVLGLLIGTYVFVSKLEPEDQEGESTEETTKTPMIVDLDRENIKKITVNNQGEEYIIEKKEDTWVLSSPTDLEYDSSKVMEVASAVASMSAEKVIEENASDLEKYGFDGSVTVTFEMEADGSQRTIELGKETNTKTGIYVKEKGSNKVYTISSYNGDTLKVDRDQLRDRTLVAVKENEIKAFTLERGGELVFSVKDKGDNQWELIQPIEGKASYDKLSPILASMESIWVDEFIGKSPTDLSKYGLDNPTYTFEVEHANGKTKILLGDEKEKDVTIYAKLSDKDEVVTLSISALNFLDTPLEEVMDHFVYLVNIEDVSEFTVEMDGKTIQGKMELDPLGDRDKDKYYINGKEATLKDAQGESYFRNFYKALIGVGMKEVEVGADPQGEAEITIRYKLKTDPPAVLVKFIPKDDQYYYVTKNGKYTGMLVEKAAFDEPGGVRDAYKKIMEALENPDASN